VVAGPPSRPLATHVELRPPIPLTLAEEVERRILFLSSDIVDFALVTSAAGVTGVTVYSTGPLDTAAVTRKVTTALDNDVRPQLATPSKVVWRSPVSREVAEGTFEDLARAGVVLQTGEGQIAMGEPLLELFRSFDRALVDLVKSGFAVRQYQYPTLISTATLQTAGYTTAFPHHLLFVTRLHNDLDVYRDIQNTYTDAPLDERLLRSCRNVDYCLPPTMCYHTFSQYSGRTVGSDGPQVVTALGKSFRFEAGYATTMERLWDFTIREIVFLGTRDEVLAMREQMMAMVFDFLQELGLSGHCEVSNDPFFGSADTSDRIVSQRMMELKYELRLPVGTGRTVSVGSFNFHNDLFGQAFGIEHSEGGPVYSACAGFGMERLVYAFLCQYGLDQRHWPPGVRS
jgi:seryl-tRNA synthetase